MKNFHFWYDKWQLLLVFVLKKDTQYKHFCVMIKRENLPLDFLLETSRTDHCGTDTEAIVHCISNVGGGSGHF